MESRAFIKQANMLSKKIKDSYNLAPSELNVFRETTQKEIAALFKGLHNPTLPSAYKLRDTSLRFGYTVAHEVQIRLNQLEHV